MDSGETIGAKRLCRTGAVKGDQVRITVSTTEGKVPMISEVGVYKASDGFELTGAAPDGMDVIDISNTDSFQFSNGWTDESGPNFIGGTNKWANAGASFTLTFEGTKVYLLGTKDPNHGTADVYIDDQLVETIDTSASSRALGQLIFESGDLADDEHTLRLKVKNKAIGIESAYVINNGGKGMIGLETDNYTMNEDTRMDVKLVRVGGSKGAVSVQVAPNPGSAIQDDFNTELITTVTFAEGQTEATAPVETRRNTNTTGDREFSIELTALTKGVIVGFNDKATVTILDTESSSKEALQTLVDEGTAAEPEWYTAGWDAYTAAITAGAAVLEKQDATVDEITEAISAINAAKEGLTAREKYTEEDPFVLPWKQGSSSTLEAEFAELKDEPLASDGKWALQIADASWASNGKYVNCLNQQDTISIPYYAEKAGTYSFTAHYRSGDPNNALSWSEADGKITEGTSTAGASDGAGATHEVTFDVVVTQAGAGTLIFTGPDKKSPQLDKFDIVLKEETGAAEVDKSSLESKIAEAKSEAEKTETYTEESIAALKNAISEAEKVFNDDAADQEAVDDQVKLLTNAINALVEIPVSEKHKVTVDSGTNGNVTVSGTDQEGYVEEGNEITVTVNANEGYVIDALTAADTSYTDAAGRSSYEFKMKVTADITIRATFKEESTEPVTPDKSALEAELKEAAEILAQTDKYTEESLAEYQKAVDAAKAVLNEEKATAEEIEAAVKALADAKTLLVEKNNDTPDPGTGDGEDKPGTGTDKPGTGSGSDKPSAGNDKPQSGKDTVKAVQTGDDTNVAIWVFTLVAAAAAGGAVIIIRKRNMK